MIEVLKQALEALENMHLVEMTTEDLQNWNKANKFLCRAIAELESQEPMSWHESIQNQKKFLAEMEALLVKTSTPQRTWVGLTRMELIECGVLPFGMSYELYQTIEAKLKELNT